MKKWNILNSYNASLDITSVLLKNRGIVQEEEIKDFLNPKSIAQHLKEFPSDFKKNLIDAKTLILYCIQQNMPIVIYGDYDSDGVCATSILYSTIFNELSYKKTLFFIPNRFEHGYGLSKKSLEEVYNLVTTKFEKFDEALLITVDTGITAVAEVNLAKQMGFKTIITDHHQKPNILPDADVILWNDQIVGAAISWILSKSLGLPELNMLELMALATVTDLSELKGFNRSVVIKGLEILNKNPNIGLKKLLEMAGKTKEITVYDLGWVLGPRINALGRMENASSGVDLLTTESLEKAHEIAIMLGQTNVKRQDETEKMFEIAQGDFLEDNLIFSVSPNYHEGIIGLVASRLVQKHYKPSIVVSFDEESKIGKGSVRSVPGINIIEILRKFESSFEKLGGHPMAAGFSVKEENLDFLKQSLTQYMNENFTQEYFQPFLDIDLELPLNVINEDFFSQISRLSPYGNANPEPIFCTHNLRIADYSYVGKENKHLSLKFFADGNFYKGIYFNAPSFENLQQHAVSLAYTLSKNEFNGKTTIDLFIKDLHL